LTFRPRAKKYYLDLEGRLNAIIEDINYTVSLVIVEGSRDEAALRKIGLRSPVLKFCSSGMPLFAFIEKVASDYRGLRVLILFDFDKEGNEMSERVSQQLTERGVKVDQSLRSSLREIMSREGVLSVESIHLIKDKAQLYI
jgi:5S rRNA maturation endonuclease (ribonuclease M5)